MILVNKLIAKHESRKGNISSNKIKELFYHWCKTQAII